MAQRPDDLEHRVASIAKVEGLAAPYDDWAEVGVVRERIRAGAFTRILKAKAPIVGRWAHEPEVPIGHTERGTMRVWDSPEGLRYEIALPNTQAGRDALVLIERDELGASIGFVGKESTKVEGAGWQEFTDVELKEISLTANPAYKGTTAKVARPPDQGIAWLDSVSA